MDKLASFQKLSHVVCLTYSAVTSLWEEKVHDNSLSRAPDNEDDIGLPSNVLEGDRPCKLVEKTAGVDSQTGECHSLGSHLKGKDLNRVEGLKRCDTEREEGAEHEDHGNGRFGGSGVLGLIEQAAGGGHANPDNRTGTHGSYHELTPTEFVDEG